MKYKDIAKLSYMKFAIWYIFFTLCQYAVCNIAYSQGVRKTTKFYQLAIDIPSEHWEGNIKSVCKKTHSIKDIPLSNKEGLISYTKDTFNESGQKTGGVFYAFDGSVKSKWVCTYDNTGKELERMSFDGDGILTKKILYKYDATGNTIETDIQTNNASSYLKTQCSYDATGDLTEWIQSSADNHVSWKKNYTYNYDLLYYQEQSTFYNKGGVETMKNTTSYKFDSNERIAVKTSQFSTNPNINTEIVYTYDQTHRINTEKHYNKSGMLFMEKRYKYDTNSTYVQVNYFESNGNIDKKRGDRWVYKYDHKGKEIEHLFYNKDGILYNEKSFIRKYEYDTAGNIIKDTLFTFESATPKIAEYTELQISYY